MQALRALLRFLAAAELSAKLEAQVLLPLAVDAAEATSQAADFNRGEQQRAQEQQWRVKCGELLAAALAELAGLKVGTLGACERLVGARE